MTTDRELVLAARAGDEAAFGAIYDRYADRVYGLCCTVLRDRAEAEDALHDAFLTAWRQLDQLREPDRLRPWLFAIARHRAMRLGKRASRAVPTDAVGEMTTDDTDLGAELDAGVESGALGVLVWEAAAGLNEGERAVLELSVREGLEGDDLAAAMGTSRHHVNVIASRMRQSLERSVAALYLARVTRRDCDELATLLEAWDGALTPLWRKRIARHADDCVRCTEARKRANPFAAFAGLPLLAAPDAARSRVFDAVRAQASASPMRLDRTGFPRAARPWRMITGAAAVTFAVGVVAGVVIASGNDGPTAVGVRTEGRRRAADATPTTTTTSSSGVASVGSSTTTTRPRVTTTTVPAPTTTTAPDVTSPTISSLVLDRTSISRSDCITSPQTIVVTVSVTDDRGVVGGSVVASTVGAVRSTTSLSGSGGAWSATVGPFSPSTPTGSLDLHVTVRDAAGNAAEDTAFGLLSSSCL